MAHPDCLREPGAETQLTPPPPIRQCQGRSGRLLECTRRTVLHSCGIPGHTSRLGSSCSWGQSCPPGSLIIKLLHHRLCGAGEGIWPIPRGAGGAPRGGKWLRPCSCRGSPAATSSTSGVDVRHVFNGCPWCLQGTTSVRLQEEPCSSRQHLEPWHQSRMLWMQGIGIEPLATAALQQQAAPEGFMPAVHHASAGDCDCMPAVEPALLVCLGASSWLPRGAENRPLPTCR